ncbi:MAG: LolA family protein [Propionicimonas sp.]
MRAQQTGQPKSFRTRTLALVAAGVLAAVGITGLAVRGAAADPVLPALTPAELLGKVAAAKVDGLSATFEQRSDLGLPALPADLGEAGDQLSSALALLTGTHTLRVWTAGDDKAKLALVDGTTESSITRNGNDVWAWSSTKQEAVHSSLTAPTPRPSGTPTSPTTAIKDLLAKVTPTTDVATSGTGYVAGRAVYQLVLTPKDDSSLVGQVRVSVDAETFVPLGLRVIADDGQDAVTIAATSVDYGVPAGSVFDFQPPAGVTVTEHKADSAPAKSGTTSPAKPKTFGSGWATVAVMDVPKTDKPDDQAKVLLESLPAVSGSWGKGRLLSTVLVNAVITDDGRVAVGSVAPERLYEALAAR